eukprot:gb/GFBE01081684.1/.p1 GENE.gb/GFBE01081684.1/~~gb/GFBE01081684.1/.p1  ORF type:complete len:486 (+),score=99.67 gb/GFBE01081684.1/:1-1458(+)
MCHERAKHSFGLGAVLILLVSEVFLRGWVTMTPTRANATYLFLQCMFIARIVFMSSPNEFFMGLGLRWIMIAVLAAARLDGRKNALSNSVMALTHCLVYVLKIRFVAEDNVGMIRWIARFCFMELVAVVMITMFGFFIEDFVRSREETILELQATKGSEQAAQGILSVLCDADVILNSRLEIQGSATKLSHLLMMGFGEASTALEGIAFDTYLAEDDRDRFSNFVNTSSYLSSTSSLHVHMRGAAGTKVAAEIYHVTIPSWTDDEWNMRHLIGIKEEARAAANVAADAVGPAAAPMIVPFAPRTASSSSRSSRSSHGSQDSRSSRHRHMERLPELEKIEVVANALSGRLNLKELRITFHDVPDNSPIMPALANWIPHADYERFSLWLQEQLNAVWGEEADTPSGFGALRFRHPHWPDDWMLKADTVSIAAEDEEVEQEEDQEGEQGLSSLWLRMEFTGFKHYQQSGSNKHGKSRSRANLPCILEG